MTSLLRSLELDGYLTLSKFVKFLKEQAPHAAISYPTALRLVKAGKLRAMKMGNQYRVTRTEADRWIAEGNWVEEKPFPSPGYFHT